MSPNTLTSSLNSFLMAEPKSRFATLSEKDLNLLLDDKNTKSTKRATKSALKVFQQYLKDKKADEPQTRDTLAGGTFYAKSTLNSPRFRLNWHFKATRGFYINYSEFTEANKLFGAMCVDLKRQGLAKVEHKPPICDEDLQNCTKALPLVWMIQKSFKTIFYWSNAARGRQNLRQLKKTHFSFNIDSTGARYVCKATMPGQTALKSLIKMSQILILLA